MSDWATKEYTKIQDYVIHNRLFKGQPDNLSHADIILNEIRRLKKQVSIHELNTTYPHCCALCGKELGPAALCQKCGDYSSKLGKLACP